VLTYAGVVVGGEDSGDDGSAVPLMVMMVMMAYLQNNLKYCNEKINIPKERHFGGKKIWRVWRNLIWRMPIIDKTVSF